MKRYLPGLLALVSLFSCVEPQRNCDDFRTGTFEFESYLEGELVKSHFIRNDSIEIDFFRGKTDTSSVRWINNCEYIISNLNPKNRAEEKPIHIKILATEGNSYTFEYGLVGEPKKQRGTVVKVE
ncbi:hypothetical protein [Salinimicrobium xinjiangense]|uniref:hypothetical protein n=1 Tax=Salinimicrobium xinjiangense TaxID=438596 RepID=UPI0004190459|nr:hypothetical protein [Salinimicrobium xinjiangense]